jgi:acyl carrier protein
MGLDAFDIKWRLEETFDIVLSTDDFMGVVRDNDISVGDLYDLLLTKLHLIDRARNDVRLNYDLWIKTQRIIHTVSQTPLHQIELNTKLESLFPRQTRRTAWAVLRHTYPYRLRELDYPLYVRGTGFALAAGMVFMDQFQLWQIPGAQWLWPVLGLFGIWMVGETYLKVLSICSPLRIRFPAGIHTVKDLCRAVLATNYEEICQDFGTGTDTERMNDNRCHVVWQQLKEILVAVLGVDDDEISFKSRLISDLGME